MIGGLRKRAQRLRQTLWAMVVAPSAWALHFLFCYTYAAVRCAREGRGAPLDDVRLAVIIATLVALTIVVASGTLPV